MVFKLIRTVLGLENSESSGETDVTVEREPDDAAAAGTDAAALTSDDADDAEPDAETPDDAAAVGTDAAASTGSMTEEPPGEGAAEPAEAAGPTATDTDEERFGDGETDVTVDEVSGIGPAYAERLSEAGIETVADLLAADPENLAESTDVSAKRIGRWQDRAEDA